MEVRGEFVLNGSCRDAEAAAALDRSLSDFEELFRGVIRTAMAKRLPASMLAAAGWSDGKLWTNGADGAAVTAAGRIHVWPRLLLLAYFEQGPARAMAKMVVARMRAEMEARAEARMAALKAGHEAEVRAALQAKHQAAMEADRKAEAEKRAAAEAERWAAQEKAEAERQ